MVAACAVDLRAVLFYSTQRHRPAPSHHTNNNNNNSTITPPCTPLLYPGKYRAAVQEFTTAIDLKAVADFFVHRGEAHMQLRVRVAYLAPPWCDDDRRVLPVAMVWFVVCGLCDSTLTKPMRTSRLP